MTSQALIRMWIHTDGYSGGSGANVLKRSKTTIFFHTTIGQGQGPFLERPGNLAHKPVNFASLTDSFISSFSKLLKLWPWMQTRQSWFSFPGPKSYRDFRETGPRSESSVGLLHSRDEPFCQLQKAEMEAKRSGNPMSPRKKPKNRYLRSEDRNLPIAAVETIQSNGWSIVLCKWGVTSRPLRLICPMETGSGQSKCYQSDHIVRKLTPLCY